MDQYLALLARLQSQMHDATYMGRIPTSYVQPGRFQVPPSHYSGGIPTQFDADQYIEGLLAPTRDGGVQKIRVPSGLLRTE